MRRQLPGGRSGAVLRYPDPVVNICNENGVFHAYASRRLYLILDLAVAEGSTLIIVSHDQRLAGRLDRRITFGSETSGTAMPVGFAREATGLAAALLAYRQLPARALRA